MSLTEEELVEFERRAEAGISHYLDARALLAEVRALREELQALSLGVQGKMVLAVEKAFEREREACALTVEKDLGIVEYSPTDGPPPSAWWLRQLKAMMAAAIRARGK